MKTISSISHKFTSKNLNFSGFFTFFSSTDWLRFLKYQIDWYAILILKKVGSRFGYSTLYHYWVDIIMLSRIKTNYLENWELFDGFASRLRNICSFFWIAICTIISHVINVRRRTRSIILTMCSQPTYQSAFNFIIVANVKSSLSKNFNVFPMRYSKWTSKCK